MAKRYSGTLTLSISYSDKDSSYIVRIREANDDARFATLRGLNLAPIHAARLAVDSAEAYDLAARAALAFASHADDAIDTYAARNEEGEYHVARRVERAWQTA